MDSMTSFQTKYRDGHLHWTIEGIYTVPFQAQASNTAPSWSYFLTQTVWYARGGEVEKRSEGLCTVAFDSPPRPDDCSPSSQFQALKKIPDLEGRQWDGNHKMAYLPSKTIHCSIWRENCMTICLGWHPSEKLKCHFAHSVSGNMRLNPHGACIGDETPFYIWTFVAFVSKSMKHMDLWSFFEFWVSVSRPNSKPPIGMNRLCSHGKSHYLPSRVG